MLQNMFSLKSVCFRLIKKVCRYSWMKISVLLFLWLIFYMLSSKDSSRKVFGSEALLGPAYTLMKHNGKLHIGDIPELSLYEDSIKLAAVRNLRQVVKSLVTNCSKTRVNYCKSPTHTSDSAILTLFTSWIFDKDKFFINNNTLFNWKKLKNVRLVVFSNDSTVISISKKAGWAVLPIKEEIMGAPVLPVMMMDVMTNFNSEFYGYANGDLLFTGSLTDTLKAIICQLTSQFSSDAMLVIGKRTNIPSGYVRGKAQSWEQLETVAAKYGKLFAADAEDYFITNKQFPWSSFLPVAIGRVGYDNWVVTYARLKNFTVIDATDTILCVHQTLESRGNYEGHHKGEYNVEMVKKLNLPLPVFTWGKTHCASTISWYDMCSNIMFLARSDLLKECTEYHWTYHILRALGMANKSIDV